MVSQINKVKLAIILVITIVFIGCNNKENKKMTDDKDTLTSISLRQEWFPYAGYAGELMAINETAKKQGLDITLEAGADNIDPIKLVISGANDFGVASADRILTANQKGAELVAIGVINYNSPTCFIAKKEKNITTPTDFKGKTIGILTGTNTEYVYKALKNKLGLDDNSIKEVEIPFDLGTFISDAYDVRPAFIYDETISLDMQEVAYTVIEPKNYGINFLGTVYFTTKKMVKEKPELVQAFVNAMAEGWELALNNPSQAIAYLKQYDNAISEKRELASLIKGKDYFKGQNGKILFSDTQTWNGMADILKQLEVIKTFNASESIDMTFVNNYHSK
ncbi:ABC transporter substrate-binding protein [Kordia jejudonensis]|uniref:ABC transporter substrate-binding protein n=1 Tax=Kordia jejudonensis TaxID=1348245 RepID=UPI000629047D|nr:ABC transporter substrate-binding protein [Kordia jejudonensis]